jgi:isopenicillin N synthase-like dioxygenase
MDADGSDRFFKQPEEDKAKIDRSMSKYFNGWRGARKTNISPTESVDVNESVSTNPNLTQFKLDITNLES